MVKLVSAKCPNCGASLKLSKEEEKTICEYCKNTIIVDDAIACYKLKISGNVSVDGVTTNAELIETANELLNMNEYLKAKRKFLEFSEKCPDNYQGWLGLLICRTRNFTIKDNNIMFENDVKKFYEHFSRVAPEDVKNQYFDIIDRYFYPEKYEKLKEQEKAEKLRQEYEELKKQAEERKKHAMEAKEKRKAAMLENPTYKTISNIGNKGIEILFKIINGILYGFGGLLVLAYLLSFKEDIISSIFAILFGLSLFKVFYSIIENKFDKIEKKYIKIARFVIPFLLLIVWIMCTPVENVETDNNGQQNNATAKDESTYIIHDDVNNDENTQDNVFSEKKSKEIVYYLKYNELGDFGKYMEFEKKDVIFYYLPDGKYKIEATSLNENICFLWIDYRDGYQNGNHGTAYNTKEMLKFTTSSKTNTTTIDSSVHIYNSNDCDYKLTLINN